MSSPVATKRAGKERERGATHVAVVSVVVSPRVRSEVVGSAVLPPFPFPLPLLPLPLPFPMTLLMTEPIPESCRRSYAAIVRRSKRVDIFAGSKVQSRQFSQHSLDFSRSNRRESRETRRAKRNE